MVMAYRNTDMHTLPDDHVRLIGLVRVYHVGHIRDYYKSLYTNSHGITKFGARFRFSAKAEL